MDFNNDAISELAKLAPAQVTPINNSFTDAIVSGVDGNGSPSQVRLKAPLPFENNPLIRLYFGYLQSASFLKLGPSTRYNKAIVIRHFLNFIEREFQFHESGIPFDIINLFFISRKKESIRQSFYNEELILTTPIKLLQKKDKNIDHRLYDDSLANYLVFCPKFPPPNSKPKRALSELFGQQNCPYTDSELIQSLRLSCCFLLNLFSDIRHLLLSDSKVSDSLNELKSENYDKKPLLSHPQAHIYNVDSAPLKQESKKAYAKFKRFNNALFETIIELENPYILELFSFKTFPRPKEDSPEAKLSRLAWVSKFYQEKRIYNQVTLDGRKYRLRRLNNITARFLINPIDLEVFCIQCLLASESIQRGGLLSHSLTDFSTTLESTQISYNKGRRNKSSATPIYNRQSLPHQCYSRYVKQRAEAHSAGINMNNNTIFYDIQGTSKGHIGFTTESFRFFALLVSPNSEIKSLLQNELGEQGEAFLWLIEKIWSHNRLAYFESIKNNNEKRRSGSKPGHAKRTNKVIGLTPDAISMSRKRIDDRVSIHEKVEADNILNDTKNSTDHSIRAELTAHSKTTKHNVYKNRSYSKEAIESERDFGAQVGNLMVENALLVGNELERVNYLSLEKVRKILGISNNINDVKELLEHVDTELWGGFQHEGETIIITSDLTAMLLKGYIEHLRLELPKLFLDDRQKGQLAQKKMAYLISILSQFPTHMQRKGEAMLDEFDVPFPSLI